MLTPDLRCLLNEFDLAKVLNVSVKTVRNWRYQNVGPRWTKVGRAVRYRPAEVEKYLQANTASERRASSG